LANYSSSAAVVHSIIYWNKQVHAVGRVCGTTSGGGMDHTTIKQQHKKEPSYHTHLNF
jgi:hypothetical protein